MPPCDDNDYDKDKVLANHPFEQEQSEGICQTTDEYSWLPECLAMLQEMNM